MSARSPGTLHYHSRQCWGSVSQEGAGVVVDRALERGSSFKCPVTILLHLCRERSGCPPSSWQWHRELWKGCTLWERTFYRHLLSVEELPSLYSSTPATHSGIVQFAQPCDDQGVAVSLELRTIPSESFESIGAGAF